MVLKPLDPVRPPVATQTINKDDSAQVVGFPNDTFYSKQQEQYAPSGYRIILTDKYIAPNSC